MGIFNRSGGSERDWGVPVLYLREQDSNLQLFPKDMRPVRRNAFMAFCAIALLVIWFVLHILPLAERLRDDLLGSIGLPVSAGLLIVWLVSRVYQQFKAALWNWGELPILDWLQKRSARLVSASALAIAALLFASTTSVYLYHPPPDSNPPNAVQIQLVDTHADTDTGSGKSFLGGLKLETTGENTSAGRPIFFPFFSPELKLTVVEPPRGWELTVNGKAPPDSLSLLPVQPIVLRVVKTVYPPMIRLLPSKTMVADENRLLPLPGEQDPLIPYRLVVTVHGADESVLKMEEWDNFQQGSIYLGSDMAKRNVFDPGKPGTRVDRLRADIENRIADLEECYPMDLSDPDTLLQWTDIWNNEKFIVLDPWPEPGQRVSVQIFEKSDDNEDLNGTVRAEYDLDIGAQQPEVYTICLNWQESHS